MRNIFGDHSLVGGQHRALARAAGVDFRELLQLGFQMDLRRAGGDHDSGGDVWVGATCGGVRIRRGVNFVKFGGAGSSLVVVATEIPADEADSHSRAPPLRSAGEIAPRAEHVRHI